MKKILTTQQGAPVTEDNISVTVGSKGPLTFDNYYAMEKLAHFNRERIPERVVHARGTGAYGTFTLTKSLKEYTIANFLQKVGEETEVFLRFSTVGGGQDSSDYARDPRGFAVKFYTKEGNYDLVGNNTPVFFLRDGIKFPDFIHSQKKDPRTNIASASAMYEFWANNPQSMHQITILMSDRGIPLSYRHMNGYGSHTFSFYNEKGERFYFKWHFKTNQGIKTVKAEDVHKFAAHGAQEDLVLAIDQGDYPTWKAYIQIMTEEEAKNFDINPFDVTKVWPHSIVPLVEVGKLELNRNVDNYFAETEQATFSPAHFVPGIASSPDKMLQARLFAYGDAHRYRVGANSAQLPVNAPKCPFHHFQRDGFMAGIKKVIADAGVNFFPHKRGAEEAPVLSDLPKEPPLPVEEDAWIGHHDNRDDDNFSQAGDLYRIMSEDQKEQLTGNIASGLKQATKEVQEIMLGYFKQCDPDYADRIRQKMA